MLPVPATLDSVELKVWVPTGDTLLPGTHTGWVPFNYKLQDTFGSLCPGPSG